MRNTVLIVTNKEDVTADFVVLELERRGWPFCRFNTEDFPGHIAAGLEFPSGEGFLECPFQQPVALRDVGSVWFRRPRMPMLPADLGTGLVEFCEREAQRFLAGLYSTLDALWVSHPDRIREAENKAWQLQVAAQLGFRVPRTLMTNKPDVVMAFFESCSAGMIAKPVRSGHIPTDPPAAVYTSLVRADDLADLSGLSLAPVIFQEHLRKKRDIRVTVIGSKVFAVSIDSQAHEESSVDWRRLQNPLPIHEVHNLPWDVEERCRSLVSTLGLRFGAIDLVLTPEGNYYFLEINPNGQWAWIELEIAIPLTSALTDLLTVGGSSR